MIIDYIKEILVDYRNSISLDNLENILKEKGINSNTLDLITHSNIFSLNNGIVFFKKTLIENKDVFFIEFDDYIKSRITEKHNREKYLDCLKFFIPDSLFVEWLNIPLERKLLVFDLLFYLFIKPKRIKDKFKIFFTKLVDFYSLVVIYSSILIQNYNQNYSSLINVIEKIEPCEEILKNHLFNILTVPDLVKIKLEDWELEFNKSEAKLQLILDKYFALANKYSPNILRRVINSEVKRFNIFYLLTRFEYSNYYEWLLILTENNEPAVHHNLFEDLGF